MSCQNHKLNTSKAQLILFTLWFPPLLIITPHLATSKPEGGARSFSRISLASKGTKAALLKPEDPLPHPVHFQGLGVFILHLSTPSPASFSAWTVAVVLPSAQVLGRHSEGSLTMQTRHGPSPTEIL